MMALLAMSNAAAQAVHIPGCTDDPNYSDASYRCDDWRGFACLSGYAPHILTTPERMQRLVDACPVACTDVRARQRGGARARAATGRTRSLAAMAAWPHALTGCVAAL